MGCGNSNTSGSTGLKNQNSLAGLTVDPLKTLPPKEDIEELKISASKFVAQIDGNLKDHYKV
jgi:hypothetical protein